MLWIIAASLLALSIVVAGSEFYSPPIVNKAYSQILDQTAKAVQLPADNPNVAKIRQELRDLTQQIVEAKQAQQAFWIQFSQMVLLNLLLPVLTAILGYVFGASRNRS